jgi:lantibiotic modifying enzyme
VGFAHGTTGIGYNLLRLAALTGRPDFKQTALATLTYERQVFSPLHQDWPDFRATRYNLDKPEMDDKWTPETEAFPSIPANFSPEFRATWCSGAPGIGLARAAALSLLDEPQMRQELEAALEATLKSGFGLNHSLCHGDLGSLELLLYVSQTQDTPGNRKKAELATQLGRVVSTIKTQGWICGTPFGVEEPGLMTGLAGIGYGLLRAASPEKIPSVLLLEAPSQ